MARTKFVSEKIFDVVGFFNPHDDDAEFHGKLLEWKPPTHDRTAGCFIVELTANCKTVLNKKGEAYSAKKGERLGVNRFTALAGLENPKYMGKIIHCAITGKVEFDDDRNPAFQANVEVED